MSLMLHRVGLLRPSIGSPAASVPDAFAVEDWSVAPGDEEADVTIHTLPDDGGATITDIEYRLDGGSWVSSGGTSSFTISGLTNDQAYEVELRAVNSVGAGAAGDAKSVTPAGEDEDWHPNNLSSPPLAIWDPTVTGSLWQDTAGSTPAGDGDPLGRIDDQSPNANHAVQSTDAKRPTFDIISGVSWIVCGGSDDGMSFTNVKPAMVAAVFYTTHVSDTHQTLFGRVENASPFNAVRVNNTLGSSGSFRVVGSGADTNDFCFNTGETRINGVLTGDFANDTPSIITVVSGAEGSQSTEGLGCFGLPYLSAGGRDWKGRIGRIVLLSAVPDSDEYANLLAWLAAPYGISL